MEKLASGILWYGVLLFSLTFHEAAHAWAALRGGDPTAYRGGQVSLDPRPHIRREPIGMLIMPLVFFAMSGVMIGWASTPLDPAWARAHPRRAGAMALAGPIANGLLALAAALALRIGLEAGWWGATGSFGFTSLVMAREPGVFDTVASFLSLALSLNLLLLVFNLIPLPPLDGSSALSLLLSEAAGRRVQGWMAHPMLALGGILVAWLVLPYLFGPALGVAASLLFLGVGR